MSEIARPNHFIRQAIAADLKAGKNNGQVITRFPPEPNGYLHIGHAKSICLNFGIAQEYGGHCSLRFDDTNPLKESREYMEAIKRDVRWLGFDWGEHLYHASDYFEQLYAWAMELIDTDKAYVDSLSGEQIRDYRGTLTEPGRNSPYRDRSIDENRDLFERMRAGEFADGAHVLRAKIDMQSANINMRDPIIYRIRRVHHHRTSNAWCIYPMYDFTHGLSDAIEGVTHSLCTLEFEDHRPLYDWFLDNVSVPCHPQQIEFSRLNLNYTVTSKRLLNSLIEDGIVSGWDDPRMPTISGMRRRGYPPAAIRDFCERVGVTKQENRIEMSLLENCVREHLDPIAARVMAVLDPLRVVIENYPEDQVEQLDATYHPKDDALGRRPVPFARELYIERDDFLEDPPKKFFRLAPGREVRLRYAYIIKCEQVIKNDVGEVIELRCTYDPETRSGGAQSNRKVKGTIHWVAAQTSVSAQVRLYDRLFNVANPNSDDFTSQLNPESIATRWARIEPSMAKAEAEQRYQFERLGYFCLDPNSRPDALMFNRTVTLRDTWAKIEQAAKA